MSPDNDEPKRRKSKKEKQKEKQKYGKYKTGGEHRADAPGKNAEGLTEEELKRLKKDS